MNNNTSIFNEWTPLVNRKLFKPNVKIRTEKEKILYPHCDVAVWLRSCDQEILEPLNGKIIGEIPKWLNGSLLRNGPGSLKVANMEFQHLFDSSALLHRFAINNGNVTYQCRFLQSEVFKKNQKANRIVVTEFGTASVPDPCQTIYERVSTIFNVHDSDNAMISVYPFGDEMFAFTEIPVIHRINKITLETEKMINISKYVSIINHTAHPHILNDGSVYNLGTSVTKTGLMHNIIKFPKTNGNMFEEAEIVASVPARWMLNPCYMHTFGITDNYFIIVEQPLSISVPSVIKNKIINKPLIGSFKWFKNEMTQFHVISKKTKQTAFKFYAETFFYLHIVNQYETSDCIIIDICCYRDPSMIDCMYIEVMKNMQSNPDYASMFRGRPLRFVLPLKYNKTDENLIQLPNTEAKAFLFANENIFVQPELLCDLGCETPRINYDNFLGKKYRYFYAISSDVDAKNPGTIIKVDTVNKNALTWCEDNCYPSEPIFVPTPNSEAEDDGIILSTMVWGHKDRNRVGLLILEARTLTEIARAEFQTPSEVPKCLHGWFCKN